MEYTRFIKHNDATMQLNLALDMVQKPNHVLPSAFYRINILAISGLCLTDSLSWNDTASSANIPKTTMFNWHTNHDLQTLHLCTEQESK